MNLKAPDLPEKITGPSAWIGSDLRSKQDLWLTSLSQQEIDELDSAADAFLSDINDISKISTETFPLPLLQGRINALKDTLINGRGFEVIRGLPIQDYSMEKAATIFCGIGSHLGLARSQNAAGHILGHVRDVGRDGNDPNARIYQTSERQTFHTDSSDVVGLLCLRDAMEGGLSLLVSLETIYNIMMEKRPDLAKLLFDPIATDRRGEIPDGAKPFFEIPVFNWYGGKLTGMYQRQYIDSAQRFDGALQLSDKHVEALNMFDALADDPDFHLSMRLEQGDIQFVYNHALLHDRTGFTDWPDPKDRRHLLRLWLSIEGDRPLPDCFKERYGSIEIGNRGGIITQETKLHVPLD